MVKVLFQPVFDRLELAEVHHEAIFRSLMCRKPDDEGPIIPVDMGAMPFVPPAPVGTGKATKGLGRGKVAGCTH